MVRVIGGGLAGCEAAWQLASAGVEVELVEMRPGTTTPAHRSGDLAELVCSNSLRSDNPTNAVGLLKREMEAMGSLVMAAARKARVPAGDALAVDRAAFSAHITRALESHPLVRVVREEVTALPEGPAILATGPLTSPALHRALEELLGEGSLSFFDAIAPVVAADSLDMSLLFAASRYGKGGGADYLNAPLDHEQYVAFVVALREAEKVPLREFERDIPHFEGCLPIEVMAERGLDTLRYGPMKSVGLVDPRTGRRPYAVVQLRQDDLAARHYNLVGFQTRMTVGAQQRVMRMIPGLANARFVRYGMVHRNSFVCAPRHLDAQLRIEVRPELRLAGQLAGVEGYVESAACGLLAGFSLAAEQLGAEVEPLVHWTAHGGLVRHLTERSPHDFQPANAAWGLMTEPPIPLPRDKGHRRTVAANAALAEIVRWRATFPFPVSDPGGAWVN
ncbi:MAG TPA: methylenetetrahydrofolate--tRNA-(uracil(54)-C(5))-methyltransferase (FADH(2)-oxidizing) TrmFO [Thermoanaerobaculaceae bacterium]|nr:methylenetetrahydrofolate--tRNA-(uracil(54)-C(5))-methyltransferase (FADH(2)-oxidizing) TrmFO [Thermoanaerobaculaceae bacterium]HRS15206.1 methylenetetrahydrofolate--tRNA-(uracil(54)-C(5))-methyltransferase (FADH(2)-oxidizing) TrmFO [Thermoanaerobaculaceae bacterium]